MGALLLELGEQVVQVEWPRVHRHLLSWRRLRPLILGPVPVELDPVVVWIVQIERLADAVVGGAAEGDPVVDQALQGVGEGAPGRVAR